MCETIQFKGTIIKINEPNINKKTGFTKKVIHFQPEEGRIFYPEFHYQKIRLLDGFQEGDEVMVSVMIWGSETKQINNVVADGILKLN